MPAKKLGGRAMTKTVQGKGQLTEEKQHGVFGICHLRSLMLKWKLRFRQKKLLIRDAFCGEGFNEIDGEMINGSPVSILEGFAKAQFSGTRGILRGDEERTEGEKEPVDFAFSDMRSDALASLKNRLANMEENGTGLYKIPGFADLVHCQQMTAADVLAQDIERMHRNKKLRTLTFIDPNGPTQLPYDQLKEIMGDWSLRQRSDVVVHVSATALKRIHGAGKSATWLQRFGDMFVNDLGAGNDAWIRTPKGGAWQWTIIAFWGCLHNCTYCYARDIAKRFYEHGFEPALIPDRLTAPQNQKARLSGDPAERNIFTGSMSDIFGKWVPEEWIDAVMASVARSPEFNFLFLTKFPLRMVDRQVPENVWLGTSVDSQARVKAVEDAFAKVPAHTRWLSIEPLIEPLTFSRPELFQWVVIGGASASSQTPAWEPPFAWTADLYKRFTDAVRVSI